jgi:hypothetical protein
MRTAFLAAAAVLTVVGLAVARWQPAVLALLKPCPLLTLTGLPCPTCGTTRAALALSHGQLTAAFAANPLAAGTLLLLLPATLASLFLPSSTPPPRTRRVLAWCGAALVLLNWGYLLSR